jgi:ketosteroid isomerase-like protein
MSEAETAQHEAEVAQAIHDKWFAYIEATRTLDMDVLLSFWAPDARLLEPGVDLQGPAVHQFMEDFWGSGGQVFTFDHRSLDLFVHGDVAYQIAQYDETFQFPGVEPDEAHGTMFLRWVQDEEGVWKADRMVGSPRDAVTDG